MITITNEFADLGMRNADCGIQIEFLICILLFSIRNWEPARRVGVRRTNPKFAIPSLCSLPYFYGQRTTVHGLLACSFTRPFASCYKGNRPHCGSESQWQNGNHKITISTGRKKKVLLPGQSTSWKRLTDASGYWNQVSGSSTWAVIQDHGCNTAPGL